jgi:transposase
MVRAAAVVRSGDGGVCECALVRRELIALGHTARIMAPEFVRPFRLSGKSDAHDAAAICAAARQPQLRFVAVQSVAQQGKAWRGCGDAGARCALRATGGLARGACKRLHFRESPYRG